MHLTVNRRGGEAYLEGGLVSNKNLLNANLLGSHVIRENPWEYVYSKRIPKFEYSISENVLQTLYQIKHFDEFNKQSVEAPSSQNHS